MITPLYLLLISLRFFSILLLLGLAVYAWRHRRKRGVLSFFWLLVSCIELGISGMSVQLIRTNQVAQLALNGVFSAIIMLPVIFLIFIVQYTGQDRWLSRRRIAALFIIPTLSLVLLWTNNYHGLFMSPMTFVRTEFGSTYVGRPDGIWFRIHSAYSFLLVILGVSILIAMIFRPFALYRQQALGLLTGCLVFTSITLIITYINISEIVKYILSASQLSIPISIFAWTIFRHQLLDVVPVARDLLIDHLQDGMLVVDAQLRLVDINPAMRQILGLTTTRGVGLPASEILHAWRAVYDLFQQSGDCQAEIPLTTADGEHYYDIRLSILTDKRGQRTGHLLIARDITARKQADAELRAAHAELHALNASKDKFFSIISHDLRSPFSTLMGFSEILEQQADTLTREEIKSQAHWLHASAERVYALLENLLNWSRLQRGAMPCQPENISVAQIADDNLALFQSKAEQKQITLTGTIDDQAWVYADYAMVNTVVRNLLSNALKFTPTGGRIDLSARTLDAEIEVTVADTGVGMEPEDCARLFRIDEQHTTAGTDGEKGSGLGLILCRELVERNGGQIRVESQPGQGTTFRCTLPQSHTL
jgi:PAS domain S-box-containing protein